MMFIPSHAVYGFRFLLFFPLFLFLLLPLNLEAAVSADDGTVPMEVGSVNGVRDLYILRLPGDPVATYTGGAEGFAPTSPRATGAARLDLESSAVREYRSYLQQQRDEVLARMEEIIGGRLLPVRTYDLTFHGVAVRLTPEEAAQIDASNLAEGVTRDSARKLQSATGAGSKALSQEEILNLIEQQGGRVVFTFAGGLLFMSLGVLGLALYEALRKRRRAMLWLVSAVLLVVTAACGSSDGNTVRIEWPGAENTSPGAALIQAPQVWFGTGSDAIPGGTMGEGVVVGIIDTGISPHSPSFAETGDDGYTHTNPRGRYYGVCDPDNTRLYNPNFPCNNKLIGAWAFAEDNYNPVDFDGHGSHVAATAAGNFVEDAIVHTPSGMNISANISGVAPHANIIAYNVVDADGNMSTTAIMSAIEQAVADEVDVINYSIGTSSATDPWAERENSEMLLFLCAREAGVWVANAAGNDGPEEGTLGDPSGAPWMNVVGSSTHDVVYRNSVTFSGPVDGLEELHGLGLSLGYGPAAVVYAGDYGDSLCEGSFDAAFDGEIVICDRGEISRVEKGQHALENGAGGMILAEVDAGDSSALMLDSHVLPAVHISQPDGDKLKQWLQDSRGKEDELMATLSGTRAVSDKDAADVISGFSSRGYNEAVPSVIKPDMAAPGGSIFAPVVDGLGYDIYNGTSMASPHVAGALALLKAQHPEWTPAQAQSALMTTSETEVHRNDAGDAATPFDAGAGRVDALRAINAALVLDESGEGYRKANPELYWSSADPGSGNPADINMPSMGRGACIEQYEWRRTLTNVSTQITSWSVTSSAEDKLLLDVDPRTFILAPGQSQTIEVIADCSSVAPEDWAFGRILLQEQKGRAPAAHLPVAVRAREYHVPQEWEIETALLYGSETLYRLQSAAATEIVAWGLQEATLIEEYLEPDPTPKDIINNDGGIYVHHIEIPAGAKALLIDLGSDESKDLDLYAGRDQDYENPKYTSGSGGSQERITVPVPEAGIWWIGVHNFEGGGEEDLFRLQYAIIGGEEDAADFPDSLRATPQNQQKSSYALNLAWDVPHLNRDTYWYGALELNMPEESVSIPLRLIGSSDDPSVTPGSAGAGI